MMAFVFAYAHLEILSFKHMTGSWSQKYSTNVMHQKYPILSGRSTLFGWPVTLECNPLLRIPDPALSNANIPPFFYIMSYLRIVLNPKTDLHACTVYVRKLQSNRSIATPSCRLLTYRGSIWQIGNWWFFDSMYQPLLVWQICCCSVLLRWHKESAAVDNGKST